VKFPGPTRQLQTPNDVRSDGRFLRERPLMGGGDETPSIPTSGSGRRRSPGRLAYRKGRKPIQQNRYASSSDLLPGGSSDIVARPISQWLSERLSQQFIVENRPGAAGNISTEAVVRALPDGYTLLLATVVKRSTRPLYRKLNFNFIRDITLQAAGGQGARRAPPSLSAPTGVFLTRALPPLGDQT
jgi:hypothetical protein